MKKLLTYGIIHLSLLIYLIYKEYKKTPQLYAIFYSITTNNTIHLLHTVFVMYMILLSSKLLTRLTIGTIRNNELTSVNDNCFLFLTDILLIVTIFNDDLTVKNLILFNVLIALKCINWIIIERIRSQVNVRIFLLITFTFILSVMFAVGSLIQVLRKPSLYILYGYEFGIVAISNLRNYFYCFSSFYEEDKRIIYVFIIDIVFIGIRLVCILLFFVATAIYFRLPFNLIREAVGTGRHLQKKIKGFLQYLRISKELAKCEDSIGDGTCPICFSEMENGKKISCGHVFHISCVKKWIETSELCPICRREMFAKDEVVVINTATERITAVPIVYDD